VRGFRFILGRRALIVFLALLVATGAFIGAPAVARTLAGSSPPGSQEVTAASTDSASTEGLPAAAGEEGALLEPSGHSPILQGEPGTWTVTNFPSSTPSAPTARNEHAMAALPGGDVLLFGGYPSGGNIGDTWLFNTAGSAWTQPTITTSTPTKRDSHAMAATPSGALLFGGKGVSNLADTWLFNNAANSWTLVPTALSSSTPTARQGHAMAATPSGILLFGGYTGSVPLGDTWLFNTTSGTCSPITITGAVPPARYDHAMAYDASSGKVVLFGGNNGSTYYNDTWLFSYDIITGNGIWTETNTPIDPTTTPTKRSSHAMAATPSGVLLFGGNNGGGETWLFDTGTGAWTKVDISYAPSARNGHAMAATPSGALLFGGTTSGAPSGRLGDTWVFNESNWSWSQVVASPAARQNTAMAATPSTATPSVALLFGGNNDEVAFHPHYFADTWLFNTGTNTWTQVTITGTPVRADNPPARGYHAMAATPEGDVLLFGGTTNGLAAGALADTWLFAYDGTGTGTWTQLLPTATPTKRYGHAMAATPSGVLLFGGTTNGSGSGALADTWLFTYDGTGTGTWTQLLPTATPTKRYGHAMAATPSGVLLFGGYDGASYYNDTLLFTYDGTGTGTWTQILPTNTPTKRYFHAMAATSLGDVLLFGGYNNVSPNYLGDTWLFNSTNTTWSNIDFTDTSTPVARYYHAMAATPSGALLFGGYNGSVRLGDTWLFSQEEPPPTSTITVTSPTSGATWTVGENATITWTSTDVTGTCTVDLSRDGGSSWTQTLTTNTATQGTFTWTTVTGTVSNNCKVRVASSDGTVGMSGAFTITHAATPTLVSLSPATATIQAGAFQSYTLIAQDTETNTWDVTPSGAYSMDPDAGGSWADNTYTASKAGTWTVSATYSQDSTNYSATASLHVTPDGFGSITVSPTDSTIAAGAPQAYLVNAFDIYGNPMGDVSATATFTTDPIAGVTIAGNTVTATQVGNYVVTAHYNSQTATAMLEVTPAALHHFTFAIIDNQVAGVGFTTTLTAYDTLGNVKIDYTGTPNLSGFDGTISPATATFLAGVSNPTLTITKAMTGTLTLSDGLISNGSNTFTVTHAASVDHLSLSPASATIVAGTTQTYTTTAYDIYANPWDVTSIGSYAISLGAGGSWSAYTYTASYAGVWTVTASFSGKNATATLEVTHGTADSLSLMPSTTTIVAGSSQQYTLIAADTQTNTWDVTSAGIYAIVEPAAGGSWSANTYTASYAGVWTVSATYDTKNATALMEVTPAALHHFTFAAIGGQVAGVGFTTTLTAYDSFNNVQTGYAGSPALSGFDGTLYPATATFLAGVSNPTLTITKAMTGTVTVTDGSVSAGSVSFTVSPSALHHLILSPSKAGILPTQIQAYQAEGFDFFNNSRGDVTPTTTFSIEAGAGGSWSPSNTYNPGNSGSWTVTGANATDTGPYGTASGTALLTVSATLHLSSPLGGEDWIRGYAYSITWTSTGVTGTTTIELSRDNGATWETLTLTTATGGSFLWTVTTPRTSQALVRVSGSSQSTQSGLFRLRDPQIDILSPIGGELWTIGSQHAITWTSTDLDGVALALDLARNGADFTVSLTTGVAASSGSWNWPVTGPGTINAKIRLVGADCQDSSPDYFTITSTLFPYIGGTTTLTTSDPWLEISGGTDTGTLWVTPLDPQYTSDPDLSQFIQETGQRSALFFDIGQEGLSGTLTIVLHFNHRLGEETFQFYLWDGAGWIKVDGTLNLVDHTFTFTIDAGELDGTPFSLGGNPAAMPSMSPWALGLLSLALLSAGGWWFSRRRGLA